MFPPKWLYFLLLLVAFELLADILAKQFSLNGRILFAILALLGFLPPTPPGSSACAQVQNWAREQYSSRYFRVLGQS